MRKNMLKMMKLDWSAIRCYHIRLLVIPAALLLLGWFSSILLVPMAVFMTFSFSINLFFIEEKGDLNRLYLTLPIERSQIVFSRYLLSFILFAAGILLSLALTPLANLFSLSKWYPDLKWNLALIAFGFLVYAFLSLFMYPLLFKLGYQKGKVWGYYIPTALVCLLYLALAEYDLFKGGTFIRHLLLYAAEHIYTVTGRIFGIGAVILAVSCLLSVKIYNKREF